MANDEALIARIVANAVKVALEEHKAESDRQSAIHTQAAVAAALANQTNHVRSLKKPDLPPVDKKHIEQWIERVEFAYTRAEIVRAKDKLAFLESKFAGCEDAQLNELLRGSTDADWKSFLDYLRDIYGRTTQDKVNALLGGFSREGRRPQQLAAHIRDRIGDITLDDVLKEVFLKEIPASVRQHAATATKNLDFQHTADHLEVYFDKQGKVLNSNNSSSNINAVGPRQQQQPQQQPRQLQSALKQDSSTRASSGSSTRSSEQASFTDAFSDEEENSDINAVRFRSDGQRQQFNVENRSQSRGRDRKSSISNSNSSNNYNNNSTSQSFSRRGRSDGRYNANSGNSRSSYNSVNSRDASQASSVRAPDAKVCSFHVKYGDKAISCREHCMLWSKHQAKGQASN